MEKYTPYNSISHSELDYTLELTSGLRLLRLARAGGASWADDTALNPLFAVYANSLRIDGTNCEVVACDAPVTTESGARHHTVRLAFPQLELDIQHHVVSYPGARLVEQWQTIRNAGRDLVRIERLDTLCLDIPSGVFELFYFTSSWGAEFEPVRQRLDRPTRLETRSGRSSMGVHPWFAMIGSDGEILSGAPVWSGNWSISFEPDERGGCRLYGGLNDWEFFKDLEPGEEIESIPIVLALGDGGDLNTVSVEYARVGRRHWYPHNAISDALPVEWNHWWSYGDHQITEETFMANVDVAAGLGIELCTLDAGWFGPSDDGQNWYDHRGDWEMVNAARFPSGIRALSNYAHDRGVRFGLWCEIEGLGKEASLARARPEFVAEHDGQPLGYLCFGNLHVEEWAFGQLDSLVSHYACDWIKLDFNVDPGAGCNRADHGHGAGDGLFEHYRGLYRVLDRLRDQHPDVLLESCSSGGLRIDLGLMRRTHLTFLSDLDWPEHSLQLFWGASMMAGPEALLHWSWSDWGDAEHPRQTFDPHDPTLTVRQLDYYARVAMLHGFGFSQRLPDLPEWVAARLARHIHDYRRHVSRFITQADLYRLTAQPERGGNGERWAAFQYSLPDRSEHLLFVFRLDGGEPERSVQLRALEPERRYTVSWLSSERVEQWSGADLLHDGLPFVDLQEEDAALLLIT